jgi:hypothetical protein
MKNKDRVQYEQVGEFVSIFRRGGRWYVHFRLNGKPHRRALRTSSKKEALRRAHATERDLIDGKCAGPLRGPKIKDVVDKYITHLRSLGRSVKTIQKYNHCFQLVIELAAELNVERIDQLDLAFIDAFREKRVRFKRAQDQRATTQFGPSTPREGKTKDNPQ